MILLSCLLCVFVDTIKRKRDWSFREEINVFVRDLKLQMMNLWDGFSNTLKLKIIMVQMIIQQVISGMEIAVLGRIVLMVWFIKKSLTTLKNSILLQQLWIINQFLTEISSHNSWIEKNYLINIHHLLSLLK